MIFFKLAIKSLRNRAVSGFLTVVSIALSVTLLLAVERTRRASEEGFTQSVSQADLLVGARTGPLNLILYTIFNMGSASNNISMKSYQEIKSNPAVDWTIPYSLGDGHKGFRVIATDENFYTHYRFRGDHAIEFQTGQPALDIWDVVIGSEVQNKLKYHLNDAVVVAHGVTRGEGIQLHDDKPFQVRGILKPTGTAIDQTVYISLYGMEAIHSDWQNGVQPGKAKLTPRNQIKKESLKTTQITSFFLRAKSRIETLRLQREINNYSEEPLLAIIPGATLADLWRGLGQIEIVLKIISVMVMCVGLVSMLSAILASLNSRRREMSILRSIGAGPFQLTLLFIFESSFLTGLGILTGLFLELAGFFILSDWLESQFGFYIVGSSLTLTECCYLGLIFIFGTVIGLIPAYQASQLALKDGLSVRI